MLIFVCKKGLLWCRCSVWQGLKNHGPAYLVIYNSRRAQSVLLMNLLLHGCSVNSLLLT